MGQPELFLSLQNSRLHRLNLLPTNPVSCPAGLLAASPAFAADGVSFSTPGSGAKVSNPVHVEMNVKGLEVRPAGEQSQAVNVGSRQLWKGFRFT